MDKPGNKQENDIAPPGGTRSLLLVRPQPAEEPIELRKLFPGAQQDLDTLFPDPNMKKLLKEIVENRKRNESFVKKINIEVGKEKEESE